MAIKSRITQVTVLPEDEPIFSESATHIKIQDEAAGEFIRIEQNGEGISIDPTEWMMIREVVEKFLKELRK